MDVVKFRIGLAFCFIVYILGAFMIPLMDIDASQYASISREMLERGSFLQIFDLGKDYLDKPPMLFWLSALSMKIFGVHDWAYRIPSLLFIGIAIYSTYQFALLYYGTSVARLASLILASAQAFFLIAHDVRTDTMLVGFVMLSIYLIAKWDKEQTIKSFVFASMAVAGGMMTKGPIAVVVPIVAFVPYWISKKDWKKLYHPHYLIGVIVIAILLMPMSWGLYQQYDLHPGKLINGRPITSGLKFYYWTQSFGRYTGENFYKEMGYFTFLLENMFWSFLPWIFTFMVALLAKAIGIVKEGIFLPKQERISFFGFVFTYIILARSQAQLPHYIFVVFPLAAVLTAGFWYESIITTKGFTKPLKWLLGLHVFIYIVLIILLSAIVTIPFGIIPWWGWAWILALLLLLIWILRSQQSRGLKWFYSSIVLMVGINFVMNSHFYPNLLQYQWGNSLAIKIENEHWDKNKMFLYKMDNSNALHFYGQHIFPKLEDSLQMKNDMWVITEKKNDSLLLKQYPHSVQKYSGSFYHVTLLTLPFLNPKTREGELQAYSIWEIKN